MCPSFVHLCSASPGWVQESQLSLAGVIAKNDSWEMPVTGKSSWQTTQPSYSAFIWVNQCSDAYLGHKYSDINCIYSCDSCVPLPVIYLALLSFRFTPCGAVKSAAYHWQSFSSESSKNKTSKGIRAAEGCMLLESHWTIFFFFGLFYLKEELCAFCPNSRIRLFLYDPEVIEANNPTD